MRNNKGMMTIEACVIIPVIIFMTIMIIWIGMLSYNRNAINSAKALGEQFAVLTEQMSEALNEIFVAKKNVVLTICNE